MKKIMFFLLIVIFMFLVKINSFAQTIFKDAKELSILLDGNKYENSNKIIRILAKYSNEKNPTPEKLKIEFQINKFLYPIISDLMINSEEVKLQDARKIRPLNEFWDRYSKMTTYSSTEAIKMPMSEDLAFNIADNLAKILIKRAKEYLFGKFFEKLKSDIKDHKYLKHLLKNTCEYLDEIINEDVNYQSILPSLQEALQKDLKGCWNSTYKIMKEEEKTVTNSSIKSLLQSFILFATILDKIEKKHHFIKIIEDIRNSSEFDTYKYITPYVDLIYVFSTSLKENNVEWITMDQYYSLIKEEQPRKIFLGLIYQKFCTDTSFSEETRNRIESILKNNVTVFETFLHKTEDIKFKLESLVNKENDASIDAYLEYTDEIISLLSVTNNCLTSAGIKLPDFNLEKVDSVINIGKDIYYDIKQKSMLSILLNTKKLLKKCEIATSFIESNEMKYILFFAALVNANTDEEINTYLEAIILPASSFDIKYKSNLNIGINAYLGGFYGYYNKSSKDNVIYGFSAPIGFELSHGIGKKASIGLFLPILDIASSVTYRLANSDSVNNNFSFNDIVSPGAYLTFSTSLVADIPLSVGAGIQWGPYLETEEQNKKREKLFRYSFVFSLDLPLFNIFTKPNEF